MNDFSILLSLILNTKSPANLPKTLSMNSIMLQLWPLRGCATMFESLDPLPLWSMYYQEMAYLYRQFDFVFGFHYMSWELLWWWAVSCFFFISFQCLKQLLRTKNYGGTALVSSIIFFCLHLQFLRPICRNIWFCYKTHILQQQFSS